MLAAELERVLRLELDPAKTMLGINNRDLGTFRVDISNNQRIMDSAAGQQVRMQCSRHSCGMYYSRQGFLLLNAVGNSAFGMAKRVHAGLGILCMESMTCWRVGHEQPCCA